MHMSKLSEDMKTEVGMKIIQSKLSFRLLL